MLNGTKPILSSKLILMVIHTAQTQFCSTHYISAQKASFLKRISDLELNSPQSQEPIAVVSEPATHQLSTASSLFGAASGNYEVFDSFAQQAPSPAQVSSSDQVILA